MYVELIGDGAHASRSGVTKFQFFHAVQTAEVTLSRPLKSAVSMSLNVHSSSDGNVGLPPPDGFVPDDGTPFSDDPVEHATLSAALMVIVMVTWLIFGHKIQGMFSWCDLLPCTRAAVHSASSVRTAYRELSASRTGLSGYQKVAWPACWA